MMENLEKLMDVAKTNVGFLLLSVTIVAIIVGAAYAAERVIGKKIGLEKRRGKQNVRRMVTIAVLSTIAVVLMFFEFPLWFAPGFYKLDFSELPVIIGAFTFGPVAGITIELIKVVLNLLSNGTTTAFVGEFANFLMGCVFIIPASFFYFLRKSKKNAVIGLLVGTVTATLAGCFLNAFVLLPKYSEAFHVPIESFIAQGTEKISAIKGMFTFVVLAVAPFNLLKYALTSLITILIYKNISKILKGDYKD
ncbi:ECF transporter S component [Lachnoclostridium sp.]|nr:ECF transporter S component [Lachnoclostridium sp.]